MFVLALDTVCKFYTADDLRQPIPPIRLSLWTLGRAVEIAEAFVHPPGLRTAPAGVGSEFVFALPVVR